LIPFFTNHKTGKKEKVICHRNPVKRERSIHKAASSPNHEEKTECETMKIELQNFQWLMHHLLPPTSMQGTIHGCEVLFPDTAFFYEGQSIQAGLVRGVIKTD